jgi:anti-anti-sigma regulatory factor/HAMP domain-containing protein
MQHISWQGRITVRYLAVAISVLLLCQVLFGIYQINAAANDRLTLLNAVMVTQARFLGSVSPEAVLKLDFLTLNTLVQQSHQDSNVVYCVIVDKDGHPLASFVDTANSLIPTMSTTANQDNILSIIAQVRQNSEMREQRAPIIVADQPIGEIWLGYSILSVQQQTREVAIRTGWAICVMSLLLIGLTIFLFTHWISRPLQSLGMLAQAFAAGQHDRRMAVARQDEIGLLSNCFNTMADQLQHTLDGLEQRVVDRTAALETALNEVQARASEQERLLAEIARQRETIHGLSVPILPIGTNTLVMPLVGELDSARLNLVQERALQTLERSPARYLVVDITGVPIVDSQVAQGLLGLGQAIQLLGAKAVLVGIRPEVAQSIVGLGLNLEGVGTSSDLRSALGHLALS